MPRIHAQLLDRLGRTAEALRMAEAVAAAMEASPALGPLHPQPLTGRSFIVHLLDKLGRTSEALPIAEVVAAGMKASVLHGPTHPETLASPNIIAKLRDKTNTAS